MEIFGKFLNGIDAQNFCKKSSQEKKDWILKRTYMQDEAKIDEFLSKPLNNDDCGCGCGGNKPVNNQENDSNISSGSTKEIIEGEQTRSITEGNAGDSDGRPEPQKRENKRVPKRKTS